MSQHRLNLSDLKAKSPKDLLSMAEELEIESFLDHLRRTICRVPMISMSRQR